jgi:uncharacterized PurR-regulated membrane protein YhhQ (DUF165 family)
MITVQTARSKAISATPLVISRRIVATAITLRARVATIPTSANSMRKATPRQTSASIIAYIIANSAQFRRFQRLDRRHKACYA